ncbi:MULTISPECIES: hypothetical protein [Brevibacterium]|uniref:hypothetical protein n=1 Tax=Brevibacterium TaxID=1696 RepID=UPI0010F89313|nr:MULTISPECIES: hypothetical protein [unclassified Brevibacterium]MCM1013516.1 hypothetical protein [Brevibacterium sp. XM4083]
MTPAIPSATLIANPLATMIRAGDLTPEALCPLPQHLDELVSANFASATLMLQRHRGSPLASFYKGNVAVEQEAHQLLTPLLQAFKLTRDGSASFDALALAYPGLIARIAVSGTPWDYPVAFLHLCRPSTLNYLQLHEALSATGAFSELELEHFAFFGHIEDEEIATVQQLVTDAPADALGRAYALAQQLATLEQVFWERMVVLCTAKGATSDRPS